MDRNSSYATVPSADPLCYREAMKQRRSVLGLAALAVAVSFSSSLVHAQSETWAAALRPGSGDKLTLTWRQGLSSGDFTQLQVANGTAQAQRCTPDCTPIGKPTPLSEGQKEQLLSGLRSVGMESLRSADEAEMTADRELGLALPGKKARTIALPKNDWPTSSDGQGIATTLDDLLRTLVAKAEARPQVKLPQNADELASLRISLTVTTNKQPGGQLQLEHGTLTIAPEEGSLPRMPKPRPQSRLLSDAEKTQLVQALQGLDLDRLEASIPQRARPAVGDDDGRLLTLHLLPASALPDPIAKVAKRGGAVSKTAAVPAAAQPTKQPRGLRRYVADWVRSPAGPAVRLLASWLAIHLPTAPSGSAEK